MPAFLFTATININDLDFVTYEEIKPIEKALAKLGFKRIGRQFSHDHCPYFIDIDLKNLRHWAKTEGFEKKLKEFLRRLVR